MRKGAITQFGLVFGSTKPNQEVQLGLRKTDTVLQDAKKALITMTVTATTYDCYHGHRGETFLLYILTF